MEQPVDQFFSLSDFAEVVRITPVTGNRYTVEAILIEERRVEEIGQVGIEVADPEAIVATAKLRSAATGDVLTADRGVFEVRDVLPDGTGITRLKLRKR